MARIFQLMIYPRAIEGIPATRHNHDYATFSFRLPRLPLLVISPFAKRNYVDSTMTDQSSILRFIDNWNTAESALARQT
jgi:phospholipase C